MRDVRRCNSDQREVAAASQVNAPDEAVAIVCVVRNVERVVKCARLARVRNTKPMTGGRAPKNQVSGGAAERQVVFFSALVQERPSMSSEALQARLHVAAKRAARLSSECVRSAWGDSRKSSQRARRCERGLVRCARTRWRCRNDRQNGNHPQTSTGSRKVKGSLPGPLTFRPRCGQHFVWATLPDGQYTADRARIGMGHGWATRWAIQRATRRVWLKVECSRNSSDLWSTRKPASLGHAPEGQERY